MLFWLLQSSASKSLRVLKPLYAGMTWITSDSKCCSVSGHPLGFQNGYNFGGCKFRLGLQIMSINVKIICFGNIFSTKNWRGSARESEGIKLCKVHLTRAKEMGFSCVCSCVLRVCARRFGIAYVTSLLGPGPAFAIDRLLLTKTQGLSVHFPCVGPISYFSVQKTLHIISHVLALKLNHNFENNFEYSKWEPTWEDIFSKF